MTDALEAQRAGWDEAHARHSGLGGGFESFARHLESRNIREGAQLVDLVLAWACGTGQPGALRVFEETLIPVAEKSIARIDAGRDFVDECLQRLRTRLLMADGEAREPRILGYEGKGSLAGWVSVAAVRVALSAVRQTKRQNDRDEALWSEAVLFPGGVSLELQHLKARYAPQLGEGLRKACAELPERERAVLRLYFAEGLNIEKIGKVYGVHRATVARWINRTKAALTERMHAIMAEETGLPLEELASMDRLVRSQLEISFAGLLE